MQKPVFSLRFKFTLTLLFTSLVTVAVAALLARFILFSQFSNALRADAFGKFTDDVRSYIKLYGSWEEGQKHERLPDYFHRLHPENSPSNDVAIWRSVSLKQPNTRTVKPMPAPPKLKPLPLMKPAEKAAPHKPPPSEGSDQNRPPFRFLLIDKTGQALMGDPSFKKGDLVSERLRKQAKPITVNGRTEVWAVPLGTPNLNNLDNGYLVAIRRSMIVSLLVATVLATVLGMVFGARVSRNLRRLTAALQAVGDGELRQQVPVHTRDEVGVLSAAFNSMSRDLAEAHDEIQRQAEMLLELSTHDELTGLYNRRHFNEQATTLFAQAARYHDGLTIMLGDIDHFKKINDTFSHATGDDVLRQVSRILQENTREGDVVARYGGEEFVIAFPQTSIEQAMASCEKLRRLIEMYPWKKIHPDLQVTMSMGLNDDTWESGVEKMVAAADEQLYRAKHEGRNRVCRKEEEETTTVSV